MSKFVKIIFSAAFTVGVWLFWWLLYPQALGLQEQNQLFLWTGGYLGERLCVAGGLADWLSECLVQFYYIPWLGALLLAGVFLLLQTLVWKTACAVRGQVPGEWYPLSFIPSLLLLVHMGDHDVLLSFALALVLMLVCCLGYARRPGHRVLWLVAVPALYWLAGPVMWGFVVFAIASAFIGGIDGRKLLTALGTLAAGLATAVVLRYTLLVQYPPVSVCLAGINYYRMPLQLPALQVVTAAFAVIVPIVMALLPSLRKGLPASVALQTAVLVAATVLGIAKAYDKDTYEIIAYDQLVRQEQWEKVIARAEKYQPHSDVGCVSVNLALFMTGRIDELLNFYQCGTQGLLMPRVRDYISNVSTGEAFWRLGMVNSALRYAFDTQESTINNRKSGRAMCRIAECQIVNGRYKVASKYLDILERSTFYRGWAIEHEKYLGDDDAVLSDPIYGYLRTVKFENDFLYYYDEMDKMLAILYNQNRSNIMAAHYYVAYRKLQGGGAQ